RVDGSAPSERVFQFFHNERSATFAHDESIAQRIKWTTCKSRLTRPSAHRFDNVECPNSNGSQRRFGSAGHDYVCKIVANVTKCFADRNGATGATVRIRRTDAAKAEVDCNVRMSGTSEHLDSKRRLNSTRAFLQAPDVLFIGFADTTHRGAEADSDAVLRLLAGVIDLCVLEREFRRYDGELRVGVEPFQTLLCEKLFRIPLGNFAGTTDTKNARVEACDTPNAAPFRQNSVPKIIDADADACDRTDTSDDRAPSAHAVTLFACLSTKAFIQSKVLLAML